MHILLISLVIFSQVLDIDPKNDGRIRVDFSILQEPDFEQTMRKESVRIVHLQ